MNNLITFNNLFLDMEVNGGMYSTEPQSGKVDIFHKAPTLKKMKIMF